MLRRRLGTAPIAGVALLALAVPTACGLVVERAPTALDRSLTAPTSARAVADGSVTWSDGDATVAPQSLLTARIELSGATEELRLELEHAQVVSIPEACTPSGVTARASAIVDTDLRCLPAPGTDAVVVTVMVRGEDGESVDGQVVVRRGSQEQVSLVPSRPIAGAGAATPTPDLRLLSSPDFLNGDVGDLADGPGLWDDQPRGSRTTNSTNADYEDALDTILDDWQGLDPDAVLVAGDLTDGRWGYDDTDSGNFGPVDTAAQQRRALRRAARTYYPQWKQRFTERGLPVFTAMGDHEYGDDPWPVRKRRLADDFEAEYARVFTTDSRGRPLVADHPRGPSRLTAYAARPVPEVQVVTLDVFDITAARARIRVDRRQLAWLRDVLRRAERDDVEWVVVQAHTPILSPVRSRASSNLIYPGGSDSKLWRVFKRFGVDLYLTGEVHDTTATEADGIVQISHGGIFQFSLTTALLVDVFDDRLYVTLRDYDMQHSDDPDGVRLWETRREGMPANLDISAEVSTIGTTTIVGRDGGGAELSDSSGLLIPTIDAR